MTVVNTVTGEILEAMPEAEARRLTTEAQSEFRSANDHHARGWQLVQLVVESSGWISLGYRSPGEYVSREFDGALAGLDVAARRLAVREAKSLGYSERAIASVVGVSQQLVNHDAKVTNSLSPDPEVSSAPVDGPAAEAVSDDEVPEPELAGTDDTSDAIQPERASADTHTQAPAPRSVTGIDGKTYTRPARVVPRPEAEKTLNALEMYAAKAARAAEGLTPDQIRRIKPKADLWTVGLRESVETLQRLLTSLTEEK